VFESVGLVEPDGTVYMTTVANPRARAAELAQQCGISAPLAGRALARLAERGMVSRLPGRPVRYLAAAPDMAIGELIGQREAELRDARGTVHQLMESYRAASRYTNPERSVEVLVGRDAINNRVAQLQQNARVEVRGFDKPPYLSPPGHNTVNERRRLEQGIRYRVIYDREALAWPSRLVDDILVAVRDGEQARVRPELPLKMFLADDRMAVVPISSADQGTNAAYAIHRSSLFDALCTLFEAEWERARPLRLAGTPGRERPDAPTQELLMLLAAGLTDESIARSLGWSTRTTQRRIRRLLNDLGATTRFQAGMNAQARGWL
jgi:predicted transcriptional regulator